MLSLAASGRLSGCFSFGRTDLLSERCRIKLLLNSAAKLLCIQMLIVLFVYIRKWANPINFSCKEKGRLV